MDEANFLESFVSLLEEKHVSYCIVDGQAVNAYVEPLVSLDLDLVVAAGQMAEVEKALSERYILDRFPHSLNVSVPGSELRIQIQTDPRYFAFVERGLSPIRSGTDPAGREPRGRTARKGLGGLGPQSPRQQAPVGPGRYLAHRRSASRASR